jgi:hypothetical protein
MQPPKRPVLVEYLLRLVWDREEYEVVVRGGPDAIASFERAGLTPAQGEAILAAVKGRTELDAAVAEECAEFFGPGDSIWNATSFIFGPPTKPPPGAGGTQQSGE